MTKLLHNSLLWRLLQGLKRLCAGSLLALLLTKLWHSPPVNAFRRMLNRPPAAERSAIKRGLDRCSRGLWRLGQRLAPAKDASLCVAGARAVGRAVKRSVLLGWLFRNGLRTFVLTLLGLFGVMDWFLRDVLPIPALSSLWDEALLILAILLVLHRRIAAPKPLSSAVNVLGLPVVQFLGVCAVLFALTTRDPAIGLSGLRATAQSILWVFVIVRLIETEDDLMRVYYTMVFAAFAISLHGIYQYIIAVPIPPQWVDAAEGHVRTRVYSIFGSPNILGDYLLLFAPMTLALAYTSKKRWQKLAFVGMTACMVLSCLFTMSRGAWVGFAVAIVIFALLVDLRLLVVLAVGGVLSLMIPFVSSRILYLFSNAFADANARGGREMRWAKALEYMNKFGDSTYGMGFGRFGGAVAMQNQVISGIDYFYVDNYYMKIRVENGLLGLGSYLLMMAGVLWSGFRSWYAHRRTGFRPLIGGMVGGLCGVMAHCYFENIFEEPYMLVWFWCIAGMVAWLGLHRPRSQTP